MKSNALHLDNPRQSAIAAMKASIPASRWEQNMLFVGRLREEIRHHPVSQHPAIQALNKGLFDRESMIKIHLEYRHAIVQVFTDALLMAQHQSLQLEPRLAPGSKMPARFLLTLNILDEFGYRPGLDQNGYYQGNPAYAHYPLFERVLDEFGVSQVERRQYAPSGIAQIVRQFLVDSYSDYISVAALLAVAEEEVILFSPPLRRNTGVLGLDVDQGYYHVHGTTEDDTADANDDDHEDDLWLILAQAVQPEQYESLRSLCLCYCTLWSDFWSLQMRLLERHSQPFSAMA